jgi:hypothetical protein
MQIKGAQFKDIRADDREMIRSAARRAGLPVSQWLDSVIKSAAEASEQPSPAATDQGNETRKAEEFSMTALHERLHNLPRKSAASCSRMNRPPVLPTGPKECCNWLDLKMRSTASPSAFIAV